MILYVIIICCLLQSELKGRVIQKFKPPKQLELLIDNRTQVTINNSPVLLLQKYRRILSSDIGLYLYFARECGGTENLTKLLMIVVFVRVCR